MLTGVNHVTLVVADLERALSFHVELLGCRLAARHPEGAELEAGALRLHLELGAPSPGKDDSHLALATEDFVRVAGVLQIARDWRPAADDAVYVLDPDGHKLAVTSAMPSRGR